jgi:hypothetical protein
VGFFPPGIIGGDFGCGLYRRGEDYPQLVRAGLQFALQAGAPLAKHVVGGENERVVEIDLGVGVEALEDQVDVFLSQQLGCCLDGAAVFPVGGLDPLQLGFVVAVVGIRNEFVAQQIEVHAAGNHGGVPLRRVVG